MQAVTRIPLARITLWALLASGLASACAAAATLYVIRQISMTQLETEMARTASAVIETMAGVVQPLEPSTAAQMGGVQGRGLSEGSMEEALAPFRSRLYMSEGTEGSGSANTAIELVCILEGGKVAWLSTNTQSAADAERCETVPPLEDDCVPDFRETPAGRIVASQACFVANAGDYELQRDVRHGQRWLTIRVLSNMARHRQEATVALQSVAHLTTIPVAIISGLLVWLGLFRQSRRVRQFAKDVEGSWTSDGHRTVRQVGYPAEVAPVARQLASFRSRVNRARQDGLCLTVDFARAVKHVGNDMEIYRDKLERYRDKLKREELLTDDDVDDVRSICSRAREVMEGYIAGVVALNETTLIPESQPNAPPIDVCVVVRNEIDNVAWLEGKRHVEQQLEALDAQISGRDIAKRHFESMMFELLQNAFRYSNNRIRVRVERDGAIIRITIENDGQGLPKTEPERIWEWGYPAVDSRGQVAGIGLALVRRQLDLMGGRAELGTSDLDGARIVIELPSA